jgi:hypothetical protein
MTPLDPDLADLLAAVLEGLPAPVGLPFAWQHRIHTLQLAVRDVLDGQPAEVTADWLRDRLADLARAGTADVSRQDSWREARRS